MNPETRTNMNFKAHERGLVLRSEPERRRRDIVASHVHQQSELRQERHRSTLCRPSGAGMHLGFEYYKYVAPDGASQLSKPEAPKSKPNAVQRSQKMERRALLCELDGSYRRLGWGFDASRSDLDESSAIKPNQTKSDREDCGRDRPGMWFNIF